MRFHHPYKKRENNKNTDVAHKRSLSTVTEESEKTNL
jgi:hypothetical protein